MNTIIRELQIKSFELCRVHEDEFVQTDQAFECFAKLLILECYNVIMNTNDRYRREYFADKIINHFGVEL